MIYELYMRYTQPHRKYHNLKHIFRMLEVAQNRGMELTEEQVIAIWFHDAVYDVPAGEISNEQKSADLARQFHLSRHTCNAVVGMIVATETVLQPGVPTLTHDQWQICGLDLYDLGTARYWPNRDAIREECGHLSDAEWIDGRSAFLQMILGKETIIGRPFFLSDMESDGWHRDARQNISQELKRLQETSKVLYSRGS
jgi:predicted metal-dependent HD superfamily phosphohydrolase